MIYTIEYIWTGANLLATEANAKIILMWLEHVHVHVEELVAFSQCGRV